MTHSNATADLIRSGAREYKRNPLYGAREGLCDDDEPLLPFSLCPIAAMKLSLTLVRKNFSRFRYNLCNFVTKSDRYPSDECAFDVSPGALFIALSRRFALNRRTLVTMRHSLCNNSVATARLSEGNNICRVKLNRDICLLRRAQRAEGVKIRFLAENAARGSLSA